MGMSDGGNYTPNSSASNNNEKYQPTVYSPLSFSNPDWSDPSRLSFSFWSNLLKINIAPKLADNNSDYVKYDRNNSASIHLNPTKAIILARDIRIMLASPDEFFNVGVHTKNGLISFCKGSEFGTEGYVLSIRKLETDGTISSTYTYKFNEKGYYDSIRNFNESTLEFDKKYHDTIEIDCFLDLLDDFGRFENNAAAYSVVDALAYTTDRFDTNMKIIMEKLGVAPKSNKRGYNSKSLFDGDKGVTAKDYTNATLDDIANAVS